MEILPIATWSSARSQGPGLGRALAISLLLHLVIFWPSLPEERTAVAVTPLLAVLRPTGRLAGHSVIPVITASSPTQSVGTQERVVSRKRIIRDPAERHATQTLADGAGAESGLPDRPAEIVAASGALATGSVLPATPGLDADGLRGFRVALAREARRYKRYPVQAIEAGWQGTVELEVVVRGGGVAKDIRLARTSGHTMLDTIAMDMMSQALATTAVPAGLRDRDFLVTLPVVFELPQ